MWAVEITNEFEQWFESLDEPDQDAIVVGLRLLELRGPSLGRPFVDSVKGSRHSNMKELRIQSSGKPLRSFFAFDPRRTAIVLIGGDKTSDSRFYDRMIPIADSLFDIYLDEIRKEGLI